MESMSLTKPRTRVTLPDFSGKKVRAMTLFTKNEQAVIRSKNMSIAVTDGKQEYLVSPHMEVPSHYQAARQSNSEIFGIEPATGG